MCDWETVRRAGGWLCLRVDVKGTPRPLPTVRRDRGERRQRRNGSGVHTASLTASPRCAGYPRMPLYAAYDVCVQRRWTGVDVDHGIWTYMVLGGDAGALKNLCLIHTRFDTHRKMERRSNIDHELIPGRVDGGVSSDGPDAGRAGGGARSRLANRDTSGPTAVPPRGL